MLLTTHARSREGSSTALVGGTGQASAAEQWRPRAPISSRPEVFPLLRLPLCEALATVCCHPCTALREDSGVLSTGANRQEAIGVRPTPPHQSCCHNSRICSVRSNLCQCAFARCESALWRQEWCTTKSQRRISGAKYRRNLQVVHGRCKEKRVSCFESCQHVCSVTQLSHFYPSSWKCNVPSCPLHGR